jgi:hypothetical protein
LVATYCFSHSGKGGSWLLLLLLLLHCGLLLLHVCVVGWLGVLLHAVPLQQPSLLLLLLLLLLHRSSMSARA